MGGAGFGSGGGGRASPAPRSDFRTTPVFLGSVPVSDDGHASITFKLPEDLTTFRIIAVASSDLAEAPSAPGRFGVADRLLQVQAPLVVRPSLPKGLRPGDEAQLAAIVNNSHGPAGTLAVTLVLESDALKPTGPTSARTQIEAGGQVRLPFEVAALRAGSGTVTMRAELTPSDPALAPISDAITLPLAVTVEKTLMEEVATYGELDDDTAVAIPMALPGKILKNHGAVEVSLDSTLLGGLRDATNSLISYPYGCAEQTSSRMIPLVALSELSKTFSLGVEDPKKMVSDGISRLLSMQTQDGGFSYWPGQSRPHPYVSGYVTWLLQMASRTGHSVPAQALERAYKFLFEITKSPDRDMAEASIYYHDLRRAIAVHTLAQVGKAPAEALDQLYERQDLPVFARAFLLMALDATDPNDGRVAALASELLSAVNEDASKASVSEKPRMASASLKTPAAAGE